jgi:hypothetical protein
MAGNYVAGANIAGFMKIRECHEGTGDCLNRLKTGNWGTKKQQSGRLQNRAGGLLDFLRGVTLFEM